MEKLSAFLIEKIGFKKEWIDQFTAEEPSEDFSPDEVLSEFNTIQAQLYESKHGKKEREQAIDEAMQTRQKTERANLNKLLGMGLSRKDTDAMSNEDMEKAAKKHLDSKISAASEATDETLRTELTEWKNNYQDLQTKFDQLEESKESEIEAAQQKADERISQFEVERYTSNLREFRKSQDGPEERTWARPQDKKVGHHYIMSQIREKYTVNPDGTMLNKDGTPATNFSGNGIYKIVDEAYEYLYNDLGYAKKSNGDEGKTPVTVNGVPGSDDLSENAKKLLERASKKGKTGVPGVG